MIVVWGFPVRAIISPDLKGHVQPMPLKKIVCNKLFNYDGNIDCYHQNVTAIVQYQQTLLPSFFFFLTTTVVEPDIFQRKLTNC